MEPRDTLKARQAAGVVAYEAMIASLIGYSPCGKLTVDDILFIARTAQTLAFNAATEVSA